MGQLHLLNAPRLLNVHEAGFLLLPIAKNMARSLFSFSLVLMLAGCLSPSKRVAEQMMSVQQAWQTNVQHQMNLPSRVLDWSQAKAMLESGNLKLRSSRLVVTNAQESVRQVFKDLRPTIYMTAGVNRKLGDISTTSWDDVNFNVNGLINFSGLVSLNARLFAAKLSLMRAEAAAVLQERTQLIELFKIFHKMALFQESLAQADVQERAARQWLALDPVIGTRALAELTAERTALDQAGDGLNEQMGDLLGDRSHRWALITDGLPVLDYSDFPLGDTNRVGRLQMQMAAIELVGAQAQRQGIKMRYWPDLYINLSGPPIYQRASGTESFWDLEDLQASAFLFWQLDTRGNISRQLRQSERNQALQVDQARLEAQSLIARLSVAQRLLVNERGQEDRITRQMEMLDQIPPPANFQGWQELCRSRRTLFQERQKLRTQAAELNTLFWFLDDAQWKQ